MKRIFTLVTAAFLAFCIPCSAAFADDAQGTTIYGDAGTPHCFYERMVQLPDGTLLATWLREFPVNSGWTGMQAPQFFASTDGGGTWSLRSEITPENDGISGISSACPACLYCRSSWENTRRNDPVRGIGLGHRK